MWAEETCGNDNDITPSWCLQTTHYFCSKLPYFHICWWLQLSMPRETLYIVCGLRLMVQHIQVSEHFVYIKHEQIHILIGYWVSTCNSYVLSSTIEKVYSQAHVLEVVRRGLKSYFQSHLICLRHWCWTWSCKCTLDMLNLILWALSYLGWFVHVCVLHIG